MQTKDEFKQWLQGLPPQTEFCTGLRTRTCPIAMFTGDMACKDSDENPEWANRFMRLYDDNQSSTLTDALRIAETL